MILLWLHYSFFLSSFFDTEQDSKKLKSTPYSLHDELWNIQSSWDFFPLSFQNQVALIVSVFTITTSVLDLHARIFLCKSNYKSKFFCYLAKSWMIKHINAYDVDLLNYRSFMFLFDKSISLFTYLFIRGEGGGGLWCWVYCNWIEISDDHSAYTIPILMPENQ